jgi:hypothetical protein
LFVKIDVIEIIVVSVRHFSSAIIQRRFTSAGLEHARQSFVLVPTRPLSKYSSEGTPGVRKFC